MTTPTHDPAIEQEADHLAENIRSASESGDGYDLDIHKGCRRVLMPLLRELATLRRGAATVKLTPEQVSELHLAKRLADDALVALAGSGICTPEEGFLRAPHCLSSCIEDLRKERDEARSKLAALSAPFDDAKLREIEERAAKANGPRTDVGFGISLDTATEVYPELDAEELGETYFLHLNAMTAEKLHDKSAIAAQLAWRDKQIDTLLAALRSRGGEGGK